MVETLTLQQRAERLRVLEMRAELDSSHSLEAYLDHVVIDCKPDPMCWPLVREPWQEDICRPMIPAVEQACGMRSGYGGPRNFWITLPRGHDKTSLQGRILTWCIRFAKNPIRATGAASTVKQAEILLEHMRAENRLNPWVEKGLQQNNYKVTGPGGRLQIISADVGSNSGKHEDIYVCDELTYWKNRELWDMLISGTVKRPDCVYIIITNAGILDSWQHKLFLQAKENKKRWHVYEAPAGVRLASWMKEEEWEAIRSQLLPSFARRVIDNEWVSDSDETLFPGEYFGDDIWVDQWPDEFELSAIAVDPSMAKNVKTSDYQAVVFAGLAHGMLWIDCLMLKVPPLELVNQVIAYYDNMQPNGIGIEANGFQELLAPLFDLICEQDGHMPLPIDMINNGSDAKKRTRIFRLDPHLKRRKVRFLRTEHNKVLVSQLKRFGEKNVNDDGPDAMEMAIRELAHLNVELAA